MSPTTTTITAARRTLRLGDGPALPALLLGLPAPDAAVPVRADEDVGGRAPREAGDAVGAGALDAVVGRGRHFRGRRGRRSEGGHIGAGACPPGVAGGSSDGKIRSLSKLDQLEHILYCIVSEKIEGMMRTTARPNFIAGHQSNESTSMTTVVIVVCPHPHPGVGKDEQKAEERFPLHVPVL
jgi:hypothetical protein